MDSDNAREQLPGILDKFIKYLSGQNIRFEAKELQYMSKCIADIHTNQQRWTEVSMSYKRDNQPPPESQEKAPWHPDD